MIENLRHTKNTLAASVSAAALILAAGCSSQESTPDQTAETATVVTEGHFAIECADGSMPGIVETGRSSSMPINPELDDSHSMEQRVADAMIAITCFGEDGKTAPQVKEDHHNGGLCLGYEGDQHHLQIEVSADKTVTFFVNEDAPNGEALVGVVNDHPEDQADNQELTTLVWTDLHHHYMEDPLNQRDFNDNCA